MWKFQKLLAQIDTVREVHRHVIVSGGLAWHLMSPKHEESKELHDHKDVDLFVIPERFAEVIAKLKARGFTRYWTKYDSPKTSFYRYGKSEEYDPPGKQIAPWMPMPHVKVLLDLFVENVPSIRIGGFSVVEPSHLLSLYNTTHSSGKCVAVQAARILLARGISPVDRPELVGKRPKKRRKR